MKTPNLYLTGFMGSGKTTVGKTLAAKLRRGFLDTDELAARRARRTVPDIFSLYGESSFRRLEESVVQSVSRRRGLVVALGGGALLSAKNRRAVRGSGTTIFLKCPVSVLLRRCKGKGRPLLGNSPDPGQREKRIRTLLDERQQGYAQAGLIVQAGDSPLQVVEMIMKKLNIIRNILVLHGPNLNMLGSRQPEIYGTMTLAEINEKIRQEGKRLGLKIRIFQSNHEGSLIDRIQKNHAWPQALLINPAALTHYSLALRDAIEGAGLPAVEVHLTDIRKREPFRRKSVIAPVCEAQFMGKGWRSYLDGLRFLSRIGPPFGPI